MNKIMHSYGMHKDDPCMNSGPVGTGEEASIQSQGCVGDVETAGLPCRENHHGVMEWPGACLLPLVDGSRRWTDRQMGSKGI